MAANIQLNSGSGGDKLAAVDLGAGVKLQKGIEVGQASTANNTTSFLTSGATYTGGWEQNDYPDVMVSCHTDNPGTLYFDFSPDGTNVNTFPVGGFKVAAGIHEFHTAVKGPRYFRVRLVNDTGNQSFLRLYTYFGQFRQGNLPINAPIGADADAIVVRSVSAATDLAFGKFTGMTEDEKFGSVRLIDAADTPADVWAYGSDDVVSGAQKTFPTGIVDFFISSDNTSDTNVDVTVGYIDVSGYSQTTTVNLNGQTPVDLGVDGFDVFRAFNSGSVPASGNIYINTENNHSAGVPVNSSSVLAYISQEYGQT